MLLTGIILLFSVQWKSTMELSFPSKFPHKYKFIEADVDIQMTTSKFKDSFVSKSRTYTIICTWLLVWSQLCTIFVVVCCPTGYKILFLLHYLLMSLAVSPRKLSLWPKSVEVSTLFEPLSLNIVECVLLLNIFQFLFNILSHQAKAIAQKCIFKEHFHNLQTLPRTDRAQRRWQMC